jgi:hypothetical protein
MQNSLLENSGQAALPNDTAASVSQLQTKIAPQQKITFSQISWLKLMKIFSSNKRAFPLSSTDFNTAWHDTVVVLVNGEPLSYRVLNVTL